MLGPEKGADNIDLFTETYMNKYYAQQELLVDVYGATNVQGYREHVTGVLDRGIDEVDFSQVPPKYLEEGSDIGVIEGTLWGRWQWWSVLGLYPSRAVFTQVWPSIFISIATG
ncbi:FAD fmn-containing dehydrogenase [Fusarium sporotrichioides]|uniref:FAD fmn-containing dehydrogenase n=1 Tax=Fusarium sporotrichioides TaxID=5514 RepID=A0A395S0Y2_FUSSP|nr:FAD fmn-containing dehydrogenase [Fusarium sporotrichioides]